MVSIQRSLQERLDEASDQLGLRISAVEGPMNGAELRRHHASAGTLYVVADATTCPEYRSSATATCGTASCSTRLVDNATLRSTRTTTGRRGARRVDVVHRRHRSSGVRRRPGDQDRRGGHAIEVEAVARRVSGVRAAVVVPPADGEEGATLFVEASPLLQAVLRELSRQIDEMKVPARCVVLPELPFNANGKVERSRLVSLAGGAQR